MVGTKFCLKPFLEGNWTKLAFMSSKLIINFDKRIKSKDYPTHNCPKLTNPKPLPKKMDVSSHMLSTLIKAYQEITTKTE